MNRLLKSGFIIIEYSQTFFICHKKQFCLNGFVSRILIDDLWSIEFCIEHKDHLFSNVNYSFVN